MVSTTLHQASNSLQLQHKIHDWILVYFMIIISTYIQVFQFLSNLIINYTEIKKCNFKTIIPLPRIESRQLVNTPVHMCIYHHEMCIQDW